GVGGNTPGIIKYPFWRMTRQNPRAVYACVNLSAAYCPKELRKRTICIEGDIFHMLAQVQAICCKGGPLFLSGRDGGRRVAICGVPADTLRKQETAWLTPRRPLLNVFDAALWPPFPAFSAGAGGLSVPPG